MYGNFSCNEPVIGDVTLGLLAEVYEPAPPNSFSYELTNLTVLFVVDNVSTRRDLL